MEENSDQHDVCQQELNAIRDSLEVLGGKWKLQIMRHLNSNILRALCYFSPFRGSQLVIKTITLLSAAAIIELSAKRFSIFHQPLNCSLQTFQKPFQPFRYIQFSKLRNN